MTKNIVLAQEGLHLAIPDGGTTNVEKYEFEPIKGYPMLNWRGKRPFTSTQYYPAQLKEVHGDEVDGWRNQIFWGDNLQVMSHLLKQFRGKIDLIYIDPPFDSKADYKKSIQVRSATAVENDQGTFEDKQYTDIWTNDAYLQFMYERLVLLRELMTTSGAIYLHCDWHKSHHLRCLLDEIFGAANFRNEITWVRSTNPKGSQHKSNKYDVFTDTIFCYAKTEQHEIDTDAIRIPLTPKELDEKYFRVDEKGRFYDGPIVSSLSMGPRPTLVYEYGGYTPPISGWRVTRDNLMEIDRAGDLGWTSNGKPFRKLRPEDDKGKPIGNFWADISLINSQSNERLGYPTQKPEQLLERILTASSKPGDLVFDCFMGSGTTQAVAMKLGRRFIGADINLGAIQTTTKRLIKAVSELRQKSLDGEAMRLTGFELYNVNHYDVFRNPVQAKELLIEALEVQKLEFNTVFDGEKDGRMVKIMPVNRIATRADLNELIAGFDYKAWERKQNENPNRPVERITLVCMGHEPDLRAQLELAAKPFKIDVEVVDILRDKADLEFKRDSQAKLAIKKGELVIEKFYPMNLLQKLSLQKESVEDWKELAESVLIDWNYDGAVLQPVVVDIPGKNELVKGAYKVPEDAGTIRVKITDLLSESWEGSVSHGN
ncbi:site-specific DNA-methyltransferase [Burkholderia cepacia]|uniref:site-specific DNA-methyltransferase n=1 Tax=Burkholderia cepacia TaxID=292 RepID=UPI001ABBE15C|nr:site-specific DNA-methyltransferase [Burkholderia cepacia]MCA8162954.1 site-specific DNA-methyltransferase [Burkholderia cepacia]